MEHTSPLWVGAHVTFHLTPSEPERERDIELFKCKEDLSKVSLCDGILQFSESVQLPFNLKIRMKMNAQTTSYNEAM